MGKILGSWSRMRKYLEKEMLADSLQGLVRYDCTSYPGMDGCHIFVLYINGKPIKRFSWETVNTYFIEKGYKTNKNPVGNVEYWEEFWPLLTQYPVDSRTEYTDEEFCEALAIYRAQDIRESIRSPHPIVRMFALLDRRLGKRTLEKLKKEIIGWPGWLQELYAWRESVES